MKNKKYFIYAHSAVKPQKSEYSKINTQIQLLKGLAEKFDYTILDVITEYGSGKRPKLVRMIEGIKRKEADGFLCYSWDTLTRNHITFWEYIELFEKNNIEVILLRKENPFARSIKSTGYLRTSTQA